MATTLKKIKFSPLQILVHLTAAALFGVVAWTYWGDPLAINPIQAVTQRTGKFALIFLVLSLACTPLNTVFGFRQALTVRRSLGLYAFMFASIHFMIFIGLDYGFDWALLQLEILDKRFILVGASALLILLPLAVTSFRWWMRKLGKNWKRLHRLVYLAGILVVVHYAWAKKGDLLRLQGDTLQPALFGLVVLVLLLLRVPAVRRGISSLRRRPIFNVFSRSQAS